VLNEQVFAQNNANISFFLKKFGMNPGLEAWLSKQQHSDMPTDIQSTLLSANLFTFKILWENKWEPGLLLRIWGPGELKNRP
jgi:hypothetical protein